MWNIFNLKHKKLYSQFKNSFTLTVISDVQFECCKNFFQKINHAIVTAFSWRIRKILILQCYILILSALRLSLYTNNLIYNKINNKYSVYVWSFQISRRCVTINTWIFHIRVFNGTVHVNRTALGWEKDDTQKKIHVFLQIKNVVTARRNLN